MSLAPINHLLSRLPVEERQALAKLFEPVALPLRTVLFEPDQVPHHVHFLTEGLASIVTYMADGSLSEVGLVAHEGVPEGLHLLGSGVVHTRCFMQIAGSGLRIRFRDFEQHYHRNEATRSAVLAFVQYQHVALSQVAACNRLHEVEARLARWLLTVGELTGEAELRLTQEVLSQMLGARRSTVTLVAGTLQEAGCIEYRRGEVRILNREALEEVACECYQVCRDALRRFKAGTPTDRGKSLGSLRRRTDCG